MTIVSLLSVMLSAKQYRSLLSPRNVLPQTEAKTRLGNSRIMYSQKTALHFILFLTIHWNISLEIRLLWRLGIIDPVLLEDLVELKYYFKILNKCPSMLATQCKHNLATKPICIRWHSDDPLSIERTEFLRIKPLTEQTKS